MSAGICGKRLGFEEIFGSAPAAPSAKRSRCSGYGSPIRPLDLGLGSDDKVSFLLRMFPSMDREVVETILNAHDHKIDDAIKSLHALCLGDVSVRNEALGQSAAQVPDDHVDGFVNAQTSEQRVEDLQNSKSNLEPGLPQDGSSWVDIFMQEMMKASNWDDVRGRVTKILEAFERSVITNSRALEELEIASLKEQLQCLLRENQILKRAVAIQHERNLEHEEKLKEVQQLKHMISQYQEQVRSLEVKSHLLQSHYTFPCIYFFSVTNFHFRFPFRRVVFSLLGSHACCTIWGDRIFVCVAEPYSPVSTPKFVCIHILHNGKNQAEFVAHKWWSFMDAEYLGSRFLWI